ncbi:MAG: hypothetical protein ACK5SX_00120, partial [Sandaracinobacter sp.]
MSDETGGKKGLDRRSVLIGGAVGAGAAGAVAVGAREVEKRARQFITPEAVADGPAQIGESFADSRPIDVTKENWKPGAPNVVAIILDDVGFA